MVGQEPTFSVEKYRWLKARTRLDLLYIDEDIQELPVLLQDAGEICAAALELRDTLKSSVELEEAVVANRLRKPEDGSKPPSETAIQSMIALDTRYQELQRELSTARLDAALWQNLVEALRSKSALVRASADLVQSGFINTTYYVDKRKKELRANR